jgi:hypothetical protein
MQGEEVGRGGYMYTLKRCPFCGRAAIMTRIERLDIPDWVEFSIACDSFRCRVKPRVTSFAAPDEAVRCWNRRKGKESEG